MKNRLLLLTQIKVLQYIYLNYFCKAVKRMGTGKIIPYKNACIDLEEKSQLIIGDKDVEIGLNKLKGSKAETYIRLRVGAKWNAADGCGISYGSTIEVLHNAVLDTGYFTMNSFSVMITAKHITLGQDVMIARNVVIYDSDFHTIGDVDVTESAKPVKVGNHVWITSNVTVLKGVSVGDGSIVASNTLLTENVEENTIVGQYNQLDVLKRNVKWRR